MSITVTQVYTTRANSQDDYVRYARIRNEQTDEERILGRHELVDPDDIEVGDEFAYKVNLLSPAVFGGKPPEEEQEFYFY
ncbi:MAG: hypothetical protein AB8C84_03415 [Oligoflexales bacterium]